MIIYGRQLLLRNIYFNKKCAASSYNPLIIHINRKLNTSPIVSLEKSQYSLNRYNTKSSVIGKETIPQIKHNTEKSSSQQFQEIQNYDFEQISKIVDSKYSNNISIFYSKNFDYYLLSLRANNENSELVFEDSNQLFFFTKFNFLRSSYMKNRLVLSNYLNDLPLDEAKSSLILQYKFFIQDNGKDSKDLYKLIGVLILKSMHNNQKFLNLLNLEILHLLQNKEFHILKSVIINIINLRIVSFDTKLIKLLLANINNDDKIASQLINSLKQFEENIEGYPEESRTVIALIANIVNLFQNKNNHKFIKNFIIRFLIELNLLKNNYLVAASLVLKYQIKSETTLNALINSLLVINPKSDILSIDAVIKLVENFNFNLTMTQGINLFYKSLNLRLESPSLINNKVYFFLIKHFSENKEFMKLIKNRNLTADESTDLIKEYHDGMNFSSFVNASKDLLMINIKNKNLAATYSIWMSLKDLNVEWSFLDVKLICSMIKSFRKDPAFKSIAYELIGSLPANIFKNSNIIQHLLDFSTDEKDLKLARFLLKFVENPPPRVLLRSLLKFFLVNDDDVSAQKILQLIFNKSRVQFLPSEFNEIIIIMLSKLELFDRCYRLISLQEDIRIAKFAYISFLNFMVNNSNSHMNVEIAEEFIYNLYRCYDIEAISFDNKRQLRYLSMIYVKYLLKTYNPATVLRIYQRSVLDKDSDIDYLNVPYFFKTGTQNVSQNEITSNYMRNVNLQDFEADEFSENFMLIPFGKPEEDIKDLRLYMPNEIKILALQSIIQESGKAKNYEVYLGATFELLKLGVSGIDVVISISRKANLKLREVGLKLPIYDKNDTLYQDAEISNNNSKYLSKVKLDIYKNIPNKYEQFKKFWEIEGHKITKAILDYKVEAVKQ